MAIYLITIRDTEHGVEIEGTEVANPGERNAPSAVLGTAMVANATRYLEQHGRHITLAETVTHH